MIHGEDSRFGSSGPSSQIPSTRPPSSRTPVEEDTFSGGSASDRGNKQVKEGTAHLVAFLHRNVGRPWESVRAELLAMMSPENPIQKMILDRLGELVATTVVLLEGKPHRVVSGGGDVRATLRPLCGSKWNSLYVCPYSKRLRSVSASGSDSFLRKQNPDVRPAGPLAQYRKMNGTWYWVELAFLPSIADGRCNHYDVLLHAPISDISSETLKKMYGTYDRYAISKRPLTKRELARLAEEYGDI